MKVIKQGEFEDTKGTIRSRKLKDRKNWPQERGQ
jgi:hypothetical protein